MHKEVEHIFRWKMVTLIVESLNIVYHKCEIILKFEIIWQDREASAALSNFTKRVRFGLLFRPFVLIIFP